MYFQRARGEDERGQEGEDLEGNPEQTQEEHAWYVSLFCLSSLTIYF